MASFSYGPAVASDAPARVMSLVALDALLCVAYKNGVLDIHSFRRQPRAAASSTPLLTHLRRLRLGALDFCSLQPSLSGNTLFVGATPYLFELQLPGAKSSRAAGEWGLEEAELMNCEACGRYKGPEASKTCGGCHSVRFCDEACLKVGWKDHKAACRAAASASAH